MGVALQPYPSAHGFRSMRRRRAIENNNQSLSELQMEVEGLRRALQAWELWWGSWHHPDWQHDGSCGMQGSMAELGGNAASSADEVPLKPQLGNACNESDKVDNESAFEVKSVFYDKKDIFPRRTCRVEQHAELLSQPPSANFADCVVTREYVDMKVYTEAGIEYKTLDEEAYRYHLQRGELDVAPQWARSLMGAISGDG